MRDHRHKQIAGIALIVGPALLLASMLVWPTVSSDVAANAASYATEGGAVMWAQALSLLALPLMLVAMLGLMHMLREREPVLGDIGAGLAIIGVVMGGLYAGADAALVELARQEETAATAAVLDQLQGTGVFIVGAAGGLLGVIGSIVLAVGLWRARAAPRLLAVGVAVAPLVMGAGWAVASNAVLVTGAVLTFLAFAPIGLRVLAETDAEWEHTPRFRGFTPQPM